MLLLTCCANGELFSASAAISEQPVIMVLLLVMGLCGCIGLPLYLLLVSEYVRCIPSTFCCDFHTRPLPPLLCLVAVLCHRCRLHNRPEGMSLRAGAPSVCMILFRSSYLAGRHHGAFYFFVRARIHFVSRDGSWHAWLERVSLFGRSVCILSNS